MLNTSADCGLLAYRPGLERFLFRPRQVCMVEGGSRGRGSQLMECSLDQALQGTLAILTTVRPKDLDGPTPCGQALFGPAREAPAAAGAAGQLPAFLGRAV